MACPTEKQYATLLALGGGSAGVAWLKSRTAPLVRRGWVTGDDSRNPRYHGWVRITPDGLRALALAVERYGLPDLGPGHVERRVCSDCGLAPLRQVCKRCGGSHYHFETQDAEEVLANV